MEEEEEDGKEEKDNGSSMKARDFVLFIADSPESRRVPGNIIKRHSIIIYWMDLIFISEFILSSMVTINDKTRYFYI